MYSPEFLVSKSHFTIQENIPIGTTIATFQAQDKDKGVSGEITYSLTSREIPHPFIIHPKLGHLETAIHIDREKLTQNPLQITIHAKDFGVPQMGDLKQISLFVEDENDNCPSFGLYENEPILISDDRKIGDEVVTINATDSDFGDNGLIRYKLLDDNTILRPAIIDINNSTGKVYLIVDNPDSGDYFYTVVATDSGIKSCAVSRTLNVRVIRPRVTTTNAPTTTPQATKPINTTTPSVDENMTDSTPVTTDVTTDRIPEPHDSLPLIIGISVAVAVIIVLLTAVIAVVVYKKRKEYNAVKTKENDNLEMEDM